MGYVNNSDHMASFSTFWIRDFRLLVTNLIEEVGRSQYCPTPMVGKPSAATSNVMRLESRHNGQQSPLPALFCAWRTKGNYVQLHQM
jgi:hypothetical protein